MLVKDFFGEYADYLKKIGRDKKTIHEHKRFLYGALSHSIAKINIRRLKLTDVAKVIEAGRVHGEYGSQRAVVVFRRYLKYLKDSGIKVPIDWRDIEVPKVPDKPVEYLEDEELDLLRATLNTSNLAGLRTRALIEILIDTGMRISEVAALDKSDIDWEKKETLVKNAKNNEIGKVYFTDRSLGWLKRYLDERNDNMPYLFMSGRGRMLSVTARSYLRQQTKNIGIKKHIRHHIFRRTLATKLIQKKVDIKSVQTILRHKSERTTLKYYIGINLELVKKMHQKVVGAWR